MTERRVFWITAVFLLAVLGAAAILLVTRQGVGISPDSIAYIGAGRSLASGAGLTVPFGSVPGAVGDMTHRAPFYAIMLAGSSLLDVDPLVGARWLNALLFAANIALAALLARSLARESRFAPLLAAFLTLTSLAMLNVHAYAWSEALFILLGFSGLYLLARFLENGRYRWLLAAAVLIGLANLTRYAGLPFVAVGGLGILLWSRRSWLRRFGDAALFGVLSLLPLAGWLYRNTQVGSSATSREFAFHPITRTHFFQAIDTFSGWLLLPAVLPGWLKLLVLMTVLALFMGVAVLALRQPDNGRSRRFLPHLLALFILVYLVFLVVSISFVDANTPLDDRILLPVFVAGVALAVHLAQRLLDVAAHRRALVGGITAVAIFFSAIYLVNAVRWVGVNQAQGLGFSNLIWHNTEIAAAISDLPSGTPIFSNAPGVVYILTGRSAAPLPKKVKITSQQANQTYDDDIAAMIHFLDTQAGAIILFTQLGPGAGRIEQELLETMPLQVQAQTKEGNIYSYAGGS